jgi:hypothetical protein
MRKLHVLQKPQKKKQHIFLKLYKQYIHIWIQSTYDCQKVIII